MRATLAIIFLGLVSFIDSPWGRAAVAVILIFWLPLVMLKRQIEDHDRRYDAPGRRWK